VVGAGSGAVTVVQTTVVSEKYEVTRVLGGAPPGAFVVPAGAVVGLTTGVVVGLTTGVVVGLGEFPAAGELAGVEGALELVGALELAGAAAAEEAGTGAGAATPH